MVDASGGAIGKVEAVTGDSNADIFDGLAVATEMLTRPKYVPAEQVGTITDGTVQLTLERSAFDALGEYEEPAEEEEIEPEKASFGAREEQRVLGSAPKPRQNNPWRQLFEWFGRAGRR